MQSLRSWAGDHLLATVCLCALSLAGAAVAGVSLFAVVLLALLGVGGPLAAGLSALTVPLLVVLVLAVPLAVGSTLALGAGLFARAPTDALPRPEWDNVRQWAAYGEMEYPALRRLGLAERLDRRSPEERARDRLAALKRLYVAGELDEAEFERRTGAVVDESPASRDELLSGQSALDRELAAIEAEEHARPADRAVEEDRREREAAVE